MKHRRILLVEDDEVILNVLMQALQAQGYEVACATTASEALDHIAYGRHDALLTDYDLPDMSGVDLHRNVQRLDPELGRRTMFMSGSDLCESVRRYVTLAGCGFFLKPFDLRSAMLVIRQVVEGGDGDDAPAKGRAAEPERSPSAGECDPSP